jgi:signal transduction histidine kinase
MKSIIFAGMALLAAGCMEKHVTVTTTQRTETIAGAAQQDVKATGQEDAKELGDEVNRRASEINQTEAAKRVAEGARDLGVAVTEGSTAAAERAGKALRQGGSKKNDAPEQKTATATDTQH